MQIFVEVFMVRAMRQTTGKPMERYQAITPTQDPSPLYACVLFFPGI